jgi:DnaJ like chaperone protein
MKNFNWIGRILGAIFGALLLGPVGAIIGFIAGYFFDKGLKSDWRNINMGSNQATQQTFFNTTFAIMGHVAKADGRVSEREIQLARVVMQRMGLQGDRKITAMQQFNLGKQTDFQLDHALDHLRSICHSQHLLRMFIELQVQTAYADGTPSARVKNLLQHISHRLGLGTIDFSHVEAMLYGHWQQQSSYQRHYQQPRPSQNRTSLSEAYEILGIKSVATDAEVKKAYRRKMNENHPDKLTAKGLPKEMIELATEKTQQIKAAYEQIKKQRNMH